MHKPETARELHLLFGKGQQSGSAEPGIRFPGGGETADGLFLQTSFPIRPWDLQAPFENAPGVERSDKSFAYAGAFQTA